MVKKTLINHTHYVRALAVLPNGYLASGSNDNTIKIWNLTTGIVEKTLYNHTGAVRSLNVLPDGNLASDSNDRTTKIVFNFKLIQKSKKRKLY